jgi:CBS domain-containing protein
MLARDVMTTAVISIEPSASIGQAAKLMLEHHCSGLPVVTADGKLVGIVTEGDFLQRSELATERHHSRWLEFFEPGKLAGEYVLAHGRKVDEGMSDAVQTTRPDTSLDQIVDVMIRNHIKRLPVLEGSALVEIVSRSDILRALARANRQRRCPNHR